MTARREADMSSTNNKRFWLVLGFIVVAYALGSDVRVWAVEAPCAIQVVDKDSRWPVPMVELTTTHAVKFVTDNAGRVAFDLPELMGRETWLAVASDGYEVAADGFGHHGVRVTPKPGEALTIEIKRTSIAKRLGRVTGAGLFAESQKLGLETEWRESGIVGSDSVQNAVHNGRMFWAWGDTSLPGYPLGIFDSSSATTDVRPISKFEPPLRVPLEYFRDKKGGPRGVAKMPGPGPTWLSGYVSLPDATGKQRLVATYLKIKPPMEAYEAGLCVWNDEAESFERLKVLWTKTDAEPKHPPLPQGHPVFFQEDDGKKVAPVWRSISEAQVPRHIRGLAGPGEVGTDHASGNGKVGGNGQSSEAVVGFHRVESVSQTMGHHLLRGVRFAIGLRRGVVRRSGLALWTVGSRGEGVIA